MRALPVLTALLAVLLYTMPMTAADTGAGKDLYTKKCATCHADNGEGKDTVAKMFKVEMHNLGSKEVQSKSDTDLKKIVLEGGGKMKGVKDVEAKDADDIVAYMRTFAKK